MIRLFVSLRIIISVIVSIVEFDKNNISTSPSTSTKETVSVTTIWGVAHEVKMNMNMTSTDHASGVSVVDVDIKPFLLTLILCVTM